MKPQPFVAIPTRLAKSKINVYDRIRVGVTGPSMLPVYAYLYKFGTCSDGSVHGSSPVGREKGSKRLLHTCQEAGNER